MEKFSDTYVGKTAEEIFQHKKQYYERNLKGLLEGWKKSSEERKAKNITISSQDYNLAEGYVRSLDNMDATTLATMRQGAIDLYREITMLNDHCRHRYVRPDDPYVKSEMEIIHGMIDGFGAQSEALYQRILNNPNIDPQVVFDEYIKLVGIEALSPKQTKEELEKLGDPYDEETVAQRVDIEEKGALNCMNRGVLGCTHDERIASVTAYYCKKPATRH